MNPLEELPEEILGEILKKLRSHHRGFLAKTSRGMMLAVPKWAQAARRKPWNTRQYKLIAERLSETHGQATPETMDLTKYGFVGVDRVEIRRARVKTHYYSGHVGYLLSFGVDLLTAEIFAKRMCLADIGPTISHWSLHGFPAYLRLSAQQIQNLPADRRKKYADRAGWLGPVINELARDHRVVCVYSREEYFQG